MAMAVLQPKDCLPREKFVDSGRRRNMPKSNPNPNPSFSNRSALPRRKRSPGRTAAADDNNKASTSPSPAKGLVMGQVKILKRGEALDDMTNTNTNTNTDATTNTNSSAVVKGDGEKSKKPPVAKVGGDRKRTVVKKDEKKVKFEAVGKKVDVDLKDEKKVKSEIGVKKVAATAVDLKDLKDDLVLSTTDRLGPEPEMVPKVPDFYAGFGFVDSPSPSSLPVPAFFAKKSDPTMDLIRMLRLNL